jgi:hypothetical protein
VNTEILLFLEEGIRRTGRGQEIFKTLFSKKTSQRKEMALSFLKETAKERIVS